MKNNKQKVSNDFYKWLNEWADFDKHNKCLDSKITIGNDNRPNHITDFGSGYKQAVSDIFNKVRSSLIHPSMSGEKKEW